VSAASAGLEFKTLAVLDQPMPMPTPQGVAPAPQGVVTALVAVTGIRDHVGDVITPGAFARTLRERTSHPRLLHNWGRQIGHTLWLKELLPGDAALPPTAPDGTAWPREAGALVAQFQLDLSTKDGRRALSWAQGKLGSPPWYSIGYVPVNPRRLGTTRHLDDLDLWEYSMVYHPANGLAGQVDFKGLSNLISSEHQLPPPEIEVKVRYVRDARYWGYPVGTPITETMRPKGRGAVALRQAGRVPARTVGTTPEKPARTDAEEPAWTDTEMSISRLGTMRIKTEGLSEEHVARLAEKYRKKGYQDSPIQVEETNRESIVTDGHHRLAAAERAGIKNLPVRVFKNTPEGRRAANRAMSEAELAKTQPREARRKVPKPEEEEPEGLFSEPDTSGRVRAGAAATGDIEGATTSLIEALGDERYGDPAAAIKGLLHEGVTPAELEEDLRGSDRWSSSLSDAERDDLIASALADYRNAYRERVAQQTARRQAAAEWTPPSRETFDRIAQEATRALESFEEQHLADALAKLGHDDPEGFVAHLLGENTKIRKASAELKKYLDDRRESTESSGDITERLGDLSTRDDQNLLDTRASVAAELNTDDETVIAAAETALDTEIKRRGIIAIGDTRPGDVFEFEDRRYHVAPDGHMVDPEGEVANLPRTAYRTRAAKLIERDAPVPARRIDTEQLAASAEHVVSDAPAAKLSPQEYSRGGQRADARRTRARRIETEREQAGREAGYAAAADALADAAPAQIDLGTLQARRLTIGQQSERRRPVELAGGGRLAIVGGGSKGWSVVTGANMTLVHAGDFEEIKPPGKLAMRNLANRLASLTDAQGRPAPFTATFDQTGGTNQPDWVRGWRDEQGRSLPEAVVAATGAWAAENGLTYRRKPAHYGSALTVPGGIPDADGFRTRRADEIAPGDEVRKPDGTIVTVADTGLHLYNRELGDDQIRLTDDTVATVAELAGRDLGEAPAPQPGQRLRTAAEMRPRYSAPSTEVAVRFAGDPDSPEARRDPGMGPIPATATPPGNPITIAPEQWERRWPDYQRPYPTGMRMAVSPAEQPDGRRDNSPKTGALLARTESVAGDEFQTVRYDDGTYDQVKVTALRHTATRPDSPTYVVDPTPEQIDAARTAWGLPSERGEPAPLAPPARSEPAVEPAPILPPLAQQVRDAIAAISSPHLSNRLTDGALPGDTGIAMRSTAIMLHPSRAKKKRGDPVQGGQRSAKAYPDQAEGVANGYVAIADALDSLVFGDEGDRGDGYGGISNYLRTLAGAMRDPGTPGPPTPKSEPRAVALDRIRQAIDRLDRQGMMPGGSPGLASLAGMLRQFTADGADVHTSPDGRLAAVHNGRTWVTVDTLGGQSLPANGDLTPREIDDALRQLGALDIPWGDEAAMMQRWSDPEVRVVDQREVRAILRSDSASEPEPPPPVVEIPQEQLDEAAVLSDEMLGVTEQPDGTLEASPEVADRQDRVTGLLDAREAGTYVLAERDAAQLTADRNDLRDELRLQTTLERRASTPAPWSASGRQGAVEPPSPGWGQIYGGGTPSYLTNDGTPVWMFRRGQRVRFYDGVGNQVGPEQGNVAPAIAYAHDQRWAAPSLTTLASAPAQRPGLIGAAQDHAEALRSDDAEAVTRTKARLESSLRRSRAGSTAARELADHVGDAGTANDADQVEALAGRIREEARARRAASARKRRTVRRLERDRIRSLLGEVENELARRAPPRAGATPSPVPPLSNEQYHQHAQQIEATLATVLADGRATDVVHTVGGAGVVWLPERAAQHRDVIDALWSRADAVPNGGRAMLSGGLGGAGKSTVLVKVVDPNDYFTINSDAVKEEMARRGMIPSVPGLSPMESVALVHAESSHLANLLAARAYAARKNVIWDITMGNAGTAARRVTELRDAGYTEVNAVFVDIPVETSVERALSRHRRGLERHRGGEGLGGRFVPPEVIRSHASPTANSVNRNVFDGLRAEFDNWAVFDNSVTGRPPELLDSAGSLGAAPPVAMVEAGADMLAVNYLRMHGEAGARTKVEALSRKKTRSAREDKLLAALRDALVARSPLAG
jgi:hypothetical protein